MPKGMSKEKSKEYIKKMMMEYDLSPSDLLGESDAEMIADKKLEGMKVSYEYESMPDEEKDMMVDSYRDMSEGDMPMYSNLNKDYGEYDDEDEEKAMQIKSAIKMLKAMKTA